MNCSKWAGIAILGVLFLLSGCRENTEKLPVDQIKVVSGGDQMVFCGEAFPKAIKVEVSGPLQSSSFLSPKSRKVLPDRTVFIRLEKNSQLVLENTQAQTDVAGIATFKIKSGNKIGDQYLNINSGGENPKSVIVRETVGLHVAGTGQENMSGALTEEPIELKIMDGKNQPLSKVPVYFSIGYNPEGLNTSAKITHPIVYSDENGVASTRMKLGQKTGEYFVDFEVASPEHELFVRKKSVKMFGVNLWNVLIAVAGGLSIFILGMKMMSDGLQRIAGENMKKILQLFAKNAWVAALAGTLVTAVIQASGATTVMVIGFVNAGLLNLTQAIGIIFGANIGTTVTAQLISFNLESVALPAIIVGFSMMFFKNRIVKGWSESIMGFGLLFFGMTMMSKELKILGNFPSFISFFQTFNCSPEHIGGFMPIGAVLGAIGIGALITIILQSSSAAMGIILALASSGLIDFYTSIPLLLGTNIGTTVTAFFAAFAANRVAKQAAMAHTMFNVFGAFLMVVLFYVPIGSERIPIFLYFINAITPGDVFAIEPQNIERHIAMAHTFFNVIVVILLLPFIDIFAKICVFLLPVTNEDSLKIEMLEPHLLNTPSVALDQAVSALRKMTNDAWSMVNQAVNRHFIGENIDEQDFDDLAVREQKIDKMQQAITNYLVQITRHELSEPQSALVPLLMHCTNDTERIADHVENILNLTERLHKTGKNLSKEAKDELKELSSLLESLAENVLMSLNGSDLSCVENALRTEKKINKLAKNLEDNHIERLQSGDCNMEVGVIFIEMVGEIEKIADHFNNIAERAPEIQKHYIKI